MSQKQSFYLGAKAIIEQQGSVLLLKERVKQGWELPGGRVDQEQTIEEALVRELGEEIPGSKLTKLGDVVHVTLGDFSVENGHRLCLAFFAAEVIMPAVISLSEEHTDYKWASQEDMADLYVFNAEQAALKKYFRSQNWSEL
jgi:8-oxo-dGTP pyrophosphatase MutT (NUDIX family)